MSQPEHCNICVFCHEPVDRPPTCWSVILAHDPYILAKYTCRQYTVKLINTDRYGSLFRTQAEAELALVTYKLTYHV